MRRRYETFVKRAPELEISVPVRAPPKGALPASGQPVSQGPQAAVPLERSDVEASHVPTHARCRPSGSAFSLSVVIVATNRFVDISLFL